MMMMMMQEKFFNENNRSMNYTKIIDRCQDNNCIDNDEYYQQILHINEHFKCEQDIKIILTNRFRLILLIFLILTSQSSALPIYQNQVNYIQQPAPALPVAMVQLTNRSPYPQQSYQVYRRFPTPIQQPQQFNNIPSYSNGAVVQIYDQTNYYNQQQPAAAAAAVVQTPNQQQISLQLRRERQRRAIIDKIVVLFDENGDGQLTKDELYSMALRSNMFPKFHHYLKQTPA